MQLNSWSSPIGLPEDRRLQAQVFFPRPEYHLDPADTAALDRLVREYRRVLLGQRIEVLCVGHTDSHGAEAFNDTLGIRRAEVVRGYLSQRLGAHPTFSAHPALSLGEREAVRAGTRERIAYDRRVDVLSTYERAPTVVRGEPVVITGRVRVRPVLVRRITRRVLQTSNHTVINPREPDSGDGLRDLVLRLLRSDGELAQFVFGDEQVPERRTERFLVEWRVNRIHIEQRVEYDNGYGSEHELLRWEMTYEWGPPQLWVVVNRHSVRVIRGERSETGSEQTLWRSDADLNPLLFPPDP